MESILFRRTDRRGKTGAFQELEKNEDMKREFAEMQNIVGLSGLLPREDDSLKGERNLEAMMNRQEKKLRRKRVLQIVRYTTSAAAMIALTWMLAWYMFVGSETPSYTEITVPKGQRGTFNPFRMVVRHG